MALLWTALYELMKLFIAVYQYSVLFIVYIVHIPESAGSSLHSCFL
jgi:hypothetical protein